MDIVVNRSLVVTEDMETCPHLKAGDRAPFIVIVKDGNREMATKAYCTQCYKELKTE